MRIVEREVALMRGMNSFGFDPLYSCDRLCFVFGERACGHSRTHGRGGPEGQVRSGRSRALWASRKIRERARRGRPGLYETAPPDGWLSHVRVAGPR